MQTPGQTPGLIVAPLTPFTSDLKVDEAGLARQIDYVVKDCRATMVVAAGVETQEYTYLSLAERKDLIRRTIELTDKRVPVMVGISHASFKTAIELAHDAERWGAAAVQLLAPLRPFAGPPTQGDLIAYFEAIGRETKLPITLYLNPGPGADVSIPDTIALAKLPQVQLIKESSRDLARVSRLIVEIDRAGHARYFTTMQMLLATLQLGGSGATMPPPGSEIARAVIDAFVAKDYERAAEIQLQFALFPSKWMHRGLAPAMKAAMNLIGIPAGEPYPPYSPLSRDEMTAMAATLKTTVLGAALQSGRGVRRNSHGPSRTAQHALRRADLRSTLRRKPWPRPKPRPRRTTGASPSPSSIPAPTSSCCIGSTTRSFPRSASPSKRPAPRPSSAVRPRCSRTRWPAAASGFAC